MDLWSNGGGHCTLSEIDSLVGLFGEDIFNRVLEWVDLSVISSSIILQYLIVNRRYLNTLV